LVIAPPQEITSSDPESIVLLFGWYRSSEKPKGVRVIQVNIVSVSADAISGQPVVLLRPLDDDGVDGGARMLPIWIGHPEATAILLAVQGASFPRPMTHDLMTNIIEAAGFAISRVEVTRLNGGTYYASIIMRGEDRELVIDARPSDSIALAVRVGCPIFVAEEVLDEAAVVVEDVDEEQEVEAFRDFLEHVDPSDFTS
jgi:bifunctional DNase/RNase